MTKAGISSNDVVNISPNPYTGHFTVRVPGQYFDLTFYDLNGKIHLERIGAFDHEDIDFKLQVGLYVAKIKRVDGSKVYRIVVVVAKE